MKQFNVMVTFLNIGELAPLIFLFAFFYRFFALCNKRQSVLYLPSTRVCVVVQVEFDLC